MDLKVSMSHVLNARNTTLSRECISLNNLSDTCALTDSERPEQQRKNKIIRKAEEILISLEWAYIADKLMAYRKTVSVEFALPEFVADSDTPLTWLTIS